MSQMGHYYLWLTHTILRIIIQTAQ
ncbi:hypothetical protein Rmet_6668 (plasmid) [Cupriavidus metallidurans CH34]|uniref:Uncharacterized protein n=1 Tax=Cupriavidus metallidurans (strain ATCC 43123 / DSM 2839 / NBRC 102507 / CH34) TaxID=266264 RepID=D3DY92_CUPMC|nr:hypothetical protein Rmet_6668 [Cupriavidus metallidurans CH34]